MPTTDAVGTDVITACTEEEYAPCVSWLWRHRAGWRPLWAYARGPGDVPYFASPVLTLVGAWRFSRRPARLVDAGDGAFDGARVIAVESCLGSYGMGGPGFVGIRVRPKNARFATWIVFTLWAAAEWLTVGEELLEDGYFPDERERHASEGGFRFFRLADLVGLTLNEMRIERDLVELVFAGTVGHRALRLRADSSALPVHRGSKLPKHLAPSQDLRDAVVASRRARLWLGE